MRNIEVKVLNPEVIKDAERMAICAARLTQGGHKIKSVEDFDRLYEKPGSDSFLRSLTRLPHPTLQKFNTVNVIIVGASRRFLAQITRHQNEVKFMSASLQYSDYTGAADFAVPYEILMLGEAEAKTYLETCRLSALAYQDTTVIAKSNDAAGYLMPQGLRNVLIISATVYQWKHMISQRTCRRNTSETRIVMLKIWEALRELSPALFDCTTAGPQCMQDYCHEGKMCCGHPLEDDEYPMNPHDILRTDFPLLFEEVPDGD